MNKVTLLPSNTSFFVEANETILQAALRQKVSLPHSCKTGRCNVCIARRISSLSTEEYIKTCTYSPDRNECIKIDLIPELNNIETTILPCRIDSISHITDQIIIIQLRLPPNHKLDFIPGQYINLVKGNIYRSYSIASTPKNNKIELHIQKVANGNFSNYLFFHAQVNDLLRIEAPLGTFFRRQKSRQLNKSAIFIAGGTGFAPIQSIVQTMIDNREDTPIWVYWGNREESSFYTSLPQQWAKDYDWINYCPVCSETPSSSWQGQTGLVHKAVLNDFPDLSSMEIFACGTPAMIEAAKSDFLQAGLMPNAFYADAFLSSN